MNHEAFCDRNAGARHCAGDGTRCSRRHELSTGEPTARQYRQRLVVPSGQTCVLTGVTVTGNVQVQANAELAMRPNGTQGATINGNVEVGPGGTLIVNSAGTPGGATIDGNVVANQCNIVAMFNIIVGNNYRY